MTIEIDQDTLCGYCRDYHDQSESWHCEGSQCEKITKIYLDDNGITESDPAGKTFRKLSVDDKVYLLVHEPTIPGIKECTVNRMNHMNTDPLYIGYESTGFNVPPDKMDSNNTQSYFLYKKDCEKGLQDLCMKRILRLSKVIGSIE